MAAVSNAKTSGAGWSGKMEICEVTYDYSVDGGAAGALDLFTADADLVIHRVTAKVVTAVTSGGAATVEVGKSGDTAGLVAQTGKASLTAGVVVDSKIGGYKLASGAKIIQTIGTAALTAGKIKYLIEYSKF
jgi:hypothetical protein